MFTYQTPTRHALLGNQRNLCVKFVGQGHRFDLDIVVYLCVCMLVDYILKDPTERDRLSICLTPRVYPQWLVIF